MGASCLAVVLAEGALGIQRDGCHVLGHSGRNGAGECSARRSTQANSQSGHHWSDCTSTLRSKHLRNDSLDHFAVVALVKPFGGRLVQHDATWPERMVRLMHNILSSKGFLARFLSLNANRFKTIGGIQIVLFSLVATSLSAIPEPLLPSKHMTSPGIMSKLKFLII